MQPEVEEPEKPDREKILDALFESSGGFSWFQALTWFVVQSGISCSSFWFYGLGFLLQQPVYSCAFTQPVADPDDVCTADNICKDDLRIASWHVDWSSSKSLHNWIDKLDIMCAPEWHVGLISMASFIGSLATLPWLPRLADIYGRKPVFVWTNFAQLVSYTILMFTHNLNVMIASSFLYGATSAVVMGTGFVYLMEMVPNKNATRLTSALWIID